MAKRKTLFDDRPVEISVRDRSSVLSRAQELTFIIKRDIANLNGNIANLQLLAKRPGSTSNRLQEEHQSNVVVMLQGQLANASLAFKDTLEIRTQNMKASRSRTEQFGGALASSSTSNEPANGASWSHDPCRSLSVLRSRKSVGADSPLYASNPSRSVMYDPKGKGRATDADFLALDMGAGGQATSGQIQQQGDFMQMQQMEQQDNYLQSRSTAIESIESTIAELGQIFGQLAHMVAQQGETVQRIDTDTSDIANNVAGAQSELLKYYASVSSNRALMLKIFGVIIIFFLIFVMVCVAELLTQLTHAGRSRLSCIARRPLYSRQARS